MEKAKTLLLISSICLVVGLAIGFYIGRSQTTTDVQYVKGETIHDVITGGEIPHKEITPSNPVLPMKPDTQYRDTGRTIIKEIYFKVDTAKIIAEFIKKKIYDKRLFDNNNGTFDIHLSLQYNSLDTLSYVYKPMIKVEVRKSKITPYISSSIIMNKERNVYVGGGVYIDHLGAGVNYLINGVNKEFLLNVNYKF